MANEIDAPTAALPPATPHAIRDELTEMVVTDLLGPAGGPSEELEQREDRVTGRYLIGMLAPRSTVVEAGGQDALGTDQVDDPEVGPSDKSTTSSDTFFPNSIGMSVLVETETEAILIKTEWGRYRREKSTTQINKRTGSEATVWVRSPLVGDPLPVRLEFPIFSLNPGLRQRCVAPDVWPTLSRACDAVWPRWRASGDRGASSAQAATDRLAPSSPTGATPDSE